MASSSSIIAEQRNVSQGYNGFYDIRLRRQGESAMRIEVDHSIFFNFIPNGADPGVDWSQAERDSFEQEWREQIPGLWDQTDHVVYRGFNLSLAFSCDIRVQAAGSQWQANVMKLKSRQAFRTSAILRNGYPDDYDCRFDSNDDLEKPGGRGQTAMIHEFGHMIGLPDEYKTDSPHYADKGSVMNLGAEVRERHLAHFVRWAKPHIDRVVDGRGAQPEESSRMAPLRSIAEARTPAEELAAVQSWLDSEGPEEGVHFVVRRRGTAEEVPLGEIPLDDFEGLEVEFSSTEEAEAEIVLWEPKSREALELLFVE